MRVLAVAILAALTTGSHPASGSNDLAVTIDARPIARSCAVASTGTVVAYDAVTTRIVSYRFVRSDGTVSPVGRVALTGEGVVAQSVRDTWTPRGASPWVAFEVVAPQRLRSSRAAVVARCARGALGAD